MNLRKGKQLELPLNPEKTAKKKPLKRSKRNNEASTSVPSSSHSQPHVIVVDYGSPQDMSLLITYEDHIAARIWSGEKPARMLSVPNHHKTHSEWKLDSCEFIKKLLRRTGLLHIAENAHIKYDDALCSAFTERFYPETNTFHLPFGEMTITLDDMENILGLNMDGLAVQAKRPREFHIHQAATLVSKYLHIDEIEVRKEFAKNNKQTLSLLWLKGKWMDIDDSSSTEDQQAASIAYMLHLIGSVLCPGKTKNSIGAYWIQIFKDINNIDRVSFGSAILSYLFHQLGSASRHGTSSLSGCITLLQVWIYEHFPSLGRSIVNGNYVDSLPRVCKWKPQVPNLSSVVTIRELLDDLTPQDVNWTPYQSRRTFSPLRNIIWYTGTMVCFDIAEPIYPERVIRQFGMVQTKPGAPLQTETPRKGDKAATYKAKYSRVNWHWEQWRNALLSEELRSSPVDVDIPWSSDDGYLEWFATVSNPKVQNPCRRLHQNIRQRANPSQPATGKFAQRIKHIIEIALYRNPDAAQPSSQTLSDVAWKLQNYHRDEPLAEFGETNEDQSQPLQFKGVHQDVENEYVKDRRVRRSTRLPKPVQKDGVNVYKRKKNTN